ncbi:MAG: hypothetical protein DMG10_18190 [Acidobacteria bacterium]|nr:MAG: hypothetical protein DMG10_18190 [Acidobacteriota bacterium]
MLPGRLFEIFGPRLGAPKLHQLQKSAATNSTADRKLFVILRVFVVDWAPPLPRRREDAKKTAQNATTDANENPCQFAKEFLNSCYNRKIQISDCSSSLGR